jgi:hypothetical protein
MAEQKLRVFRLGRGYNGFYCPETRFHLMGGIKPQDVYPADIPLSDAVKRGLRGGALVDVNKVVPIEEILTPKQLERYKQEIAQAKQEVKEEPQQVVQESQKQVEVEETTDATTSEARLTEEEIETKTKSELLEFIKDNNLDLEQLGLNSRSNATEVKDALKKHFGYAE